MLIRSTVRAAGNASAPSNVVTEQTNVGIPCGA
jgi:hypothetical protein